jgi:flagellar basal-body rod modification protein FlgD
MTAIDPLAGLRLGANNTTTAKSPDDQFGKDTFLKLLVAQLKYQNPLQPQDGSEFLAQTAQFTMVEKLSSLESESKSSLAANQMLAATSMIGHEVKYKDADGNDQTGVVTSVKVTSNGPLMHIGDNDISYNAIEEVHSIPTTPATTT